METTNKKETKIFNVNAGIIRLDGKVPTIGDNYKILYMGKCYGVSISNVLLIMCAGELCNTIHFKGYWNNVTYAVKYQGGKFHHMTYETNGQYNVCSAFDVLDKYTQKKVNMYSQGMNVVINCSLSSIIYKAGNFVGTYYKCKNGILYNGFKHLCSLTINKFADTYCLADLNDDISDCYVTKKDARRFNKVTREVEKKLPKTIGDKAVKKWKEINEQYDKKAAKRIQQITEQPITRINPSKPIVPMLYGKSIDDVKIEPQQALKEPICNININLDIYNGYGREMLRAKAVEMCNKKIDELLSVLR